ncbi:MAG: aldehyde dehydrogenase family protein [Myxococcales bacterium]|nr:aldehyde dehydrogenase family protein [Myxococcales bacterium]
MSAATAPAPTQSSQLDQVIAKVKEGSRTFAKLSIGERVQLLEEMRRGYQAIFEESVRATCQAKGIDFSSPISGEEWLTGPVITSRTLRLTQQTLKQIQSRGAPELDPSWLRPLPDGRLAVRVFPHNRLDATLLAKNTVEVHLQPGATAENLKEHQASFYRKPHEGKLCAVMGAGNVNSIPPSDCAYKMFAEGKTCILKMNPVNAYLGPLLENAFKSAIDRGFLAVVYGGAEEGKYLVNHPAVDEVHITGSNHTHDLMVWGPPGPEREARKKRNEPLLKKEITSELGNVSPLVVVPGPYSEDEIAYQGANIAGMVCNNASFNCNSAKLLVFPRQWEGRARLLAAISRGLERTSTRRAWYPGAEDRFRQFTEGRPNVKLIGAASPGKLPYALIQDVDPSKPEDRVFTQEPWCTILSELGLSQSDPVAFLAEAVKFLNEKVWGTLCATLIVHPKSMADPAIGEAVERAIRELRYGTVAINTWPAAAYGLGAPPWGGHPSSTLQDIQSGRGWIHNSLMLESIEKSVLRAPIKAFPVAPWLPGHRSVHTLGRRLADLEMDPSWLKVPGVAAAAMRA